MAKTIIELVDEDSKLKAALQSLLDAKYLVPGAFDPRAFLINDSRVLSKWKNRRRRPLNATDWTAIGVMVHNQFFQEVFRNHQAGNDPSPDRSTSKWLDDWEREVALAMPDDDSIRDVARNIGQYLEFTNRKSQGF